MSEITEIIEEEQGAYYLIKIKGRLVANAILKIRKAVENALDVDHNKIGFDLSETDYMDSMGIGIMVNVNKKVKDNNGFLAIINPSETIEDILKISGIDRYLDVFSDVSDIDSIFT